MSLSQSRPCSGSHLTLSTVVKMASNAWHNLSALSSTLTSLHSSLYSSHSGLPVVLQTMQALLPQGLCTRPVCFCHRAFVVHPGTQVAPCFTRSRLCFNAAFPVRSTLTPLLKFSTHHLHSVASLVCSASPAHHHITYHLLIKKTMYLFSTSTAYYLFPWREHKLQEGSLSVLVNTIPSTCNSS